jgi:AP2 domain/HNH endonuclease
MGRVLGDLRCAPRRGIMKLHLTINVPNWIDRIFAWPVLWYRKRRFGQPYRKIRLTEGKYTIVDPQDFYWLNNLDWVYKKGSKSFYAVRFDNDYADGPTIVAMHREILKPPKGLLVDHRNQNGLDNQRSNLRIATRSENNINVPKRKNTTSRFMGVSLTNGRKRWVANINHQNKRICLGRFYNEEEAAKAYDVAARKYHGEFARLNFPDENSLSAER